ncbi:hypothetical protein AB0F85_01060 [Nocardia fluminea]
MTELPAVVEHPQDTPVSVLEPRVHGLDQADQRVTGEHPHR